MKNYFLRNIQHELISLCIVCIGKEQYYMLDNYDFITISDDASSKSMDSTSSMSSVSSDQNVESVSLCL